MFILLVLCPLVHGISLQRITNSAASHVLQEWVPTTCTVVLSTSAESSPKELPGTQELRVSAGPTAIPGQKGDKDSELDLLRAQVKDLQRQQDIFNAFINKTLKVLLTPNGMMVGDKIFKTDGTRGDYDNAKESCSQMGGRVALPRDAAENNALQEIVAWHQTKAVLGTNDMVTEGRFVDQNGEVIGYSNWAPGEPNNIDNEDCVEMHPDGTWHDRRCEIGWLIICEF